MKLSKSNIEKMKEAKDVASLIEALAESGNESIRVLAADALGDLGDVESVEVLAQAALWDESDDVRSVAHDALTSILGKQTETVLESYRANPPEEIDASDAEDELDEVSEDEEGDEEEQNDSPWSSYDLDGLIMVLEGEPNLETKLKAVQVLGQIDDTRATQALARATFVDDEPRLVKAAHKALENSFGEDTDEYIETVRQMDLGQLAGDVESFEFDRDEGDEENDREEDEEDTGEEEIGAPVTEIETYDSPAAARPERVRSVYNHPANQTPVVEWDDPRKRILLPLLIGLVVLGVIIAAFVLLK